MKDRDMYAALESGANLNGANLTSRQRKLWQAWYDSKVVVTDVDALRAVCTFIGALCADFPDWYLVETAHRARKARPPAVWREVMPNGTPNGAPIAPMYGPIREIAARDMTGRAPACIRGNPYTGEDGSAYDRATGDGGAARDCTTTGWRGKPTLTRRELDREQRIAAAPVPERPPGAQHSYGTAYRHPVSRANRLLTRSAYGRVYIPGQE